MSFNISLNSSWKLWPISSLLELEQNHIWNPVLPHGSLCHSLHLAVYHFTDWLIWAMTLYSWSVYNDWYLMRRLVVLPYQFSQCGSTSNYWLRTTGLLPLSSWLWLLYPQSPEPCSSSACLTVLEPPACMRTYNLSRVVPTCFCNCSQRGIFWAVTAGNCACTMCCAWLMGLMMTMRWDERASLRAFPSEKGETTSTKIYCTLDGSVMMGWLKVTDNFHPQVLYIHQLPASLKVSNWRPSFGNCLCTSLCLMEQLHSTPNNCVTVHPSRLYPLNDGVSGPWRMPSSFTSGRQTVLYQGNCNPSTVSDWDHNNCCPLRTPDCNPRIFVSL